MGDSSDDSSGPPPLEEAPVVTALDDDSSEGGPPPLEGTGAGGAPQQQQRQTKGEKKARKAIQKLGLKPVEGITRVVLKQNTGVQYLINSPDVFRGGKKDTYVVFGVAQDAAQNAFKQAASNFGQQVAPVEEDSSDDEGPPALVEAPAAGGDAAEAAGEGEEVDETGVAEKDIGLVMAQVTCTRAQAVKALKQNGNDIVNSIMSLSF